MNNFNKGKYKEFIELLTKADEVYKMFFQDKSINLTAGSEELDFQIHPQNLPHLLGLNNIYRNQRGIPYDSMYHFYQNLMSNSEYFYQKLVKGEVPIGDIVLPYALEKSRSFTQTKSPNLINIPFIIKVSSLKKMGFDSNCEYFVFFETDEESLSGYLIGLKRDLKRGFMPSTLKFVQNIDALKKLVKEQDIHLTTHMQITDKNEGLHQINIASSRDLELKKRKYGSLNIKQDEDKAVSEDEKFGRVVVEAYVEGCKGYSIGVVIKYK